MPVYNEAGTVARAARQALRQRPVAQLVVVDDGSTDGTWSELCRLAQEDPRVQVLKLDLNGGKGAAIRHGLRQVNQEFVVIQDADLEYDPADYETVMEPLYSGLADVVYGSRFLGGCHRVLQLWHRWANGVLTFLSNLATNLCLTDMETGLKAFRSGVLKRLALEENRFGFEPEVTAKLARMGVAIYEVPVRYHGRTRAQGKKIGWRDAISAVRCIVKYSFASRTERQPVPVVPELVSPRLPVRETGG